MKHTVYFAGKMEAAGLGAVTVSGHVTVEADGTFKAMDKAVNLVEQAFPHLDVNNLNAWPQDETDTEDPETAG